MAKKSQKVNSQKQQPGVRRVRKKRPGEETVRHDWVKLVLGIVFMLPFIWYSATLILARLQSQLPEPGTKVVNALLGTGVFFFLGATLVLEWYRRYKRHKN